MSDRDTPPIAGEDVLAARGLRKVILSMLRSVNSSVGGYGFTFEQLLGAVRNRREEAARSALKENLEYLVGKGLVAKSWDEELSAHFYTITSDGVDFMVSGCPWEKLDRFSGKRVL